MRHLTSMRIPHIKKGEKQHALVKVCKKKKNETLNTVVENINQCSHYGMKFL